jgi:ubiquinone/menaquinone biosynthesis C-methylase UbiE
MSFYEQHIFPYVLAAGVRPFKPARAEVMRHATGRVLEIGIGAGDNLDCYTPAVKTVVGIDRNPALLRRAARVAKEYAHSMSVTLDQGDAQDLPYPDASFDSVVTSLVLCTIPHPDRALAEAHRVLKPGGRLVVFEHVRSERRGVARWQNRLNGIWSHLACGCNLNRDTEGAIRDAGFNIRQLRHYNHPWQLPVVAPIIEGYATK